MLPVADRKLIFVGGKGGVGKTTVAGSLALRLADSGRRCLVVSTDPAHSLGDLFRVSIGDVAVPLSNRLHGMEIDPDAEADRFIEGVSRNLRELVHPDMYGEVDRQMELARASPGSVEAAMLERVAAIMTTAGTEYETVVFDTAPTGQTLRLLSLPEIMMAWTDGMLHQRARADEMGRALKRFKAREKDHFPFMDMREQAEQTDARFTRIREVLLRRRQTFHAARRLLLDQSVSGFVIVLNPERLPILESSKAMHALRRFGISIAGIVVNRVLPSGELGPFLERRREREAEYLRMIAAEFAGLPRADVPMFERDVGGLEELRAVARFLVLGQVG